MSGSLTIDWLGVVPYATALEQQKALVEDRRAGCCGDRLLLLEHPPVVTLGRGAKEANLRRPRAELTRRGVEVHEVARGGDVTYHGPGQLVGYLVTDLAARGVPDVHACLRGIEGALIAALAGLDLKADRREGMTGVFVEGSAPPRKIASIGIGMRGWVTYHGFALNATMDLRGFDDIVPCGLHGVKMTSVAEERAAAPDAALALRTRQAVAHAFEAWLG
jgi:lipoate-protein ligase B